MKKPKRNLILFTAAVGSLMLFQNCGNFKAINSGSLYASSLSTVPAITPVPTPVLGKATLTWIASSSTQTQGYVIFQSSNGNTFTEAQRVAATATTASITGLTIGAAYWFRIQAYNSAGLSAPTATVKVQIPLKL